ncbi:membrane-bound serine protease (ClpP class) [Thermoplasmatales archaeon SCGC AB-540-F20]|nr:membrane-bound serine protease (ClpP class) [Thermoplasmatales archaeon SCGC AB-540-F20]
MSTSVFAQNSNVLIVEISSTIDQSTVEIVQESIGEAENRNSEAIVLLLDTPGGGLQETIEIWELIRSSTKPFIGYVYPQGSASWSAGTFILIGTHIAAMADNTIIGSAQPVEISFEGTRIINDSKTINALVARLQERADIYGRNKTIVGEFITKNLNLNETQALEYGVIEFVSDSIDHLLDDIDGTVINTSAGNITLYTKNAEQILYSPSFKIQILKLISNPILTSLLLVLGIISLIIGIQSPGFGAEVFGVIAILLSLIGSGFSVSTLGIFFITIGCLLLIIELFVLPGFGVVGIGGVICLIMGAVFLIPTYSNREWLISMAWTDTAIIIVLVVIGLLAAFFVFLLYKILQIRQKKTRVGTFIGERAKTIDQITPDKPGYVRFKGEYWQAKSDTTIEPNTKVIISGKDESTLIVKPREK